MRRGSRSSPALKWTVRSGAAAVIGLAFAVPLSRKRHRIPAPLTILACAAGPLAVTVLRPRTGSRDVVLFAMQMWAFTVVHELPYDAPAALERRLLTDYPIKVDRWIGRGKLPGVAPAAGAGASSAARARSIASSRSPTGPGSSSPTRALAVVLIRNPGGFPRAARQMAAVFDAGAAVYWFRADGTALVVLRGRPDRGRREGPENHGRGRRTDPGSRLGHPLRGARRQSVGGDALAALRDLAQRRRLPGPGRAGRGRARLELRPDPRLGPRLPRRALRHRPARRRRPGRGRAQARAGR